MVLNEEQWIKELREKRIAYGISQGRLAVASGITREYLNKIESGKMKPSKELLETLHKELARFNPEAPLTMLFDYVKIRFPTLDIQHIIKDILVYKNFTAIDQHTTHEKEIIELRLQDTNGIENFVKNFAKSYYTWNNSKEAIEARAQAISGYLTKELQDLNIDTIRTGIPTSSTVTDVIVWHIEQSGTDTFSATYEVDQQIKEGEQTSNVKATYTVKVHVDADGDMVIVQNPTLAPAVEKSDYEPKTPETDTSVDADTVNDATAFLETFFKLYPTATEKELAYYVSGNVLEPIGRDYLYSELVNPIFTKDGDNVKVKVAVKFLDNQTKATQVSQYELVLHKDN